jgi:site-specific DNA-methyltransferase (cytosine-N4-specific)
MSEIKDNSVDLIVTSPPYFNIKDYSKDGKQINKHSKINKSDIGSINSFDKYISQLLSVWAECERVLKPNGKICINTPLMPMLKAEYTSHYNRHVYDLQSAIQNSIIKNTNLFLYDLYIWNRTNPSKKLMFGSYPYPRNFYAQNTTEFIAVFVKDGKPEKISKDIKEKSKLTQKEWITFTKQIWDIPVPNKSDLAFGIHTAIMPEEIITRCVRMFSFVGDLVLDPFAGSGTTLKVTKDLKRQYVGYEIYEKYRKVIEEKLGLKNEKK